MIFIIMAGLILIGSPLVTIGFFYKNFGMLNSDRMKERFGSLYLNIRTDDLISANIVTLFLLRRLIYAVCIVFLD